MPYPPGSVTRPAASTALLLALAVLVSLLLPTGAAFAAEEPVAAAPAPAAATPRLPSDAVPPPGGRTEAKPSLGGKKPRAAKAPEQSRSKAAGESARESAGKAKALARAEAAGAPVAADCPVLPLAPFGDPGSAVGTATVPASGSVCFTFTAERTGLHRTQTMSPAGAIGVGWIQVFDGGTLLNCEMGLCDLPRTGVFTLRVTNTGWEHHELRTSVVPVADGTPGCLPTASTSLSAAPVTGFSPSPLAVLCQPFDARPGDRLHFTLKNDRYGEAISWIADSRGAHACAEGPSTYEKCVLAGTGPYRLIGVVSQSEGGFPAPYTLRVQRLNQPEGCQTVPVNAYGSAPTASTPGTGCKTFTATGSGRYEVYGVKDGIRAVETFVYDSSGIGVCGEYGQTCELTAGATYTVHTYDDTLVLDTAAGTGCRAVPAGNHRGTLAAGAVDCLTLPFARGSSLALNQAYGTAEVRGELIVRDATGAWQCDWTTLSSGSCKLTGTAPFRALVSADPDGELRSGPYTLSAIRTNDPSKCRALPAGDFTDRSPSAAVATGNGSFTDCLSIPATGHSSNEILQLKTLTGSSLDTDVHLIDTDGNLACSVEGYWGGSWQSCALQPGKAYTVLFTGIDRPSTHTLTRRDVTSTAKGCTVTPAVPVTGQSTAGKPVAFGSLTCHRVTTTRADDALHLNVRDAKRAMAFYVYGSQTGWLDCGRHRACGATGSTSYQVVAGQQPNTQLPAAYRVDALRFRTGATPAPECARAGYVTYGFGPVTGTLDARRSAYCVALPTASHDTFDVMAGSTGVGYGTAVPALYTKTAANTCTISGTSVYNCSAAVGRYGTPEPSVLVLGLPEDLTETVYSLRMECTSTRCGTDRPGFTGVAPAAGATGSLVTLKATGTALHPGDRILLTSGVHRISAATTSVSADGRTLTALLDLKNAATGVWSISYLTHNGYEWPAGSFTVTPPALKNTKAPAVGGSARVGAKVTAGTGTWSPAAASYTYQWRADGKNISGATAAAYTVPSTLLGKKLSVAVTARRTGYTPGTAVSAAYPVAKGIAPKATKPPTVSGTPKVGRVLTAKPGTWSPAPTSYAYQWYANGKAIAGATKATLKPATAQRGKKITVKVIARRTGHLDGSAVSKATGAVAR
ncbi:cell surface protein [Streptomyces sp. NPDC003691]